MWVRPAGLARANAARAVGTGGKGAGRDAGRAAAPFQPVGSHAVHRATRPGSARRGLPLTMSVIATKKQQFRGVKETATDGRMRRVSHRCRGVGARLLCAGASAPSMQHCRAAPE